MCTCLLVEEGQACTDVLVQLAAVRAAIDRASKLVLEDHLESCVRGAAANGMADLDHSALVKALEMLAAHEVAPARVPIIVSMIPMFVGIPIALLPVDVSAPIVPPRD